MRIGVSLSSTHQVADHRFGATWMVERAGAAAVAGMTALTIGDHHSTSVPYYQNVPMLARMLAGWPGDRPAGCLFLVPLWHPVLMAEQIGTLASIHGGTFVVQTGLGGGAGQFGAMGVDIGRRVGDFTESVAVVRALLAGETVSSPRFGIVNARVEPRPPGDVEWWMGAGVDAAIDRIARLGGDWYTSPGYTVPEATLALDRYRAACARHGHEPRRIVLRIDGYIGEDERQAQSATEPIVARGHRGIDPEALGVGTVEQVAEQLSRYAEAGFTDVMFRHMPVNQNLVLESMARLGEVQRILTDGDG